MFDKRDKKTKILFILLSFWIILAITRAFFNLSKLYTEEKNWYRLTNEQKRGKFFGDAHYFLRYLDSNTSENSKILFFTNDLRAHYLGRYYLYPEKEIFGKHDSFQWHPSKDIYEYIVIYPVNTDLITEARNTSNISRYKEIARYKGINNQIGIIYKK